MYEATDLLGKVPEEVKNDAIRKFEFEVCNFAWVRDMVGYYLGTTRTARTHARAHKNALAHPRETQGSERNHALSAKLNELQSQHKSYEGCVAAALSLWYDYGWSASTILCVSVFVGFSNCAIYIYICR